MNSLLHCYVRPLAALFGASLCLISAGAFAQQRDGALAANDRALTSIEGVFSRVEAGKSDAERDKLAGDLGAQMQSYVKAMTASFDAAIKQAEEANKSQGKQGSFEPVKAFEDLAVKHENRWKELDARAKKIAPKSGWIRMPDFGSTLAAGGTLLRMIGDALISPAEAAIALQVYNACYVSGHTQAGCATAIASAITQRQTALNQYNACWDSYANRKPAWWRDLLRGGCVAGYIARLA